MVKSIAMALAALALATGGTSFAVGRAEVVSTGKRFDVRKYLLPEGTTVVLFVQDTSTMERQFAEELEKQLPADRKLALRMVRLKDLSAPAAEQYEVRATPTAIVYDRFGKVLARSSQAEEIRAAARKGTMMGRIAWIDEDHPDAPKVYGAPRETLQRGIPGIVKTVSLRQDAFKMFMGMSQIHFSDGFLKRREHELIAAYVSALNRCKF
jgi:hypothetical protein